MTIPDKLKAGDQVVLLSPSGKIQPELLDGAEQRLRGWGLNVIRSPHCAGSYGRFSGSVQERLSDIRAALSDPSVKALFCSRGGYGAIHLLPCLDEPAIQARPKWLIGYSDITALHALWNRWGIVSLHAPMARHLSEEPAQDRATESLKQLLFGENVSYDLPPHPANKPGNGTGKLVGGNLSVLYGLRGTPYEYPWEKAILFIEDIGERAYHIERMLYNLKLGGILDKLSGLIVGQFTDCPEAPQWGHTLYQAVAELTREYGYPVLYNFPTGHVKENLPLPIGMEATLTVTAEGEGKLTFPPLAESSRLSG